MTTAPTRYARKHAGRVCPEMGLTDQQWEVFAQGAESVARAVKEETGLSTVFHHHCAGYVETPEEIAKLLSVTDPELLGLVFDTGHFAYGCGTADSNAAMVECLDRFADRIWYMHLKDYQTEVARTARQTGSGITSKRCAKVCSVNWGVVASIFPLWCNGCVSVTTMVGRSSNRMSCRVWGPPRKVLGATESIYIRLVCRSMNSDQLNMGVIGAGQNWPVACRTPKPTPTEGELGDGGGCPARRCRVVRQQTGATATTDCRQLLDHPNIQAVAICSSTDTHAQLIKEAAAAGKHIFCEKPIDHDLQRIDEAIAAAEQAGVLLQIGFNRRFDANFRRVRDAVAGGEIGEPHLLHIISRDPAPPPIEYIEKSGGLFLDMTIHDFDLARFLIGHEVEEVYAAGGVRVDPAIGAAGDLDTAMIVLKFANGVIGNIDNSRQALYGYDQRVEVFGSGGSIQAGNNFPNSTVVWGKETVYRDQPLHFFLDRYVDSYLEEMTQFVDAVLDGQPSPVDGNAGRFPVVMALAARKSYDENRPVRLDELDRPDRCRKTP